jgi:hypothetical protein
MGKLNTTFRKLVFCPTIANQNKYFLLLCCLPFTNTEHTLQLHNKKGVPPSWGSEGIRDLDTVDGSEWPALLPRQLYACGASTYGWVNHTTGLEVVGRKNILSLLESYSIYCICARKALSLGIRRPKRKAEAPTCPMESCSDLVTIRNTSEHPVWESLN